MTEATLKSALVKELRLIPNAVVMRHEDRFTHGIPDISVTLNGIGSWYEVKFANPKFQSKGIQELTMLRLAVTSTARYIVYSCRKDEDARTYLVHPSDIGKNPLEWDAYYNGFAHKWIADYVRGVHDKQRTNTNS